MGTEPGKVRPVLVVQTDLLNDHHPSTIVCPLTTNVQPGAEVLRVHVRSTHPRIKNSDVMVDQIRAIDNRRLLKKVGALDSKTVSRVKDNLKIVLDIEM